MKLQKILSGTLLALVTFALGLYVGFNNSMASGQTVAIDNSSPTFDLSKRADFADFWEVWQIIEKRHPDGTVATDEEKVWGAIKGLVASVGDPYTTYLTPEENEDLQTDLKGEFSGVGMEVGMKEGFIKVIAPLKDSPAEKAGVMAGDTVLKIDETFTSDLTLDKAVDLIRGPAGTPVKITIGRESADSVIELTIIRAVIVVPDIETEYLRDENVFVITFSSFGDSSAKEFGDALKVFAGTKSKKLIIDLRNNPGGYLSAAVDISSWFLEEGDVIVSEESPDTTENRTFTARGHRMTGNYEVVILVNEGSASASEIMAGALQEHGVAKLVGKQTFGKGSVQELIPMDDGTALKITIAKWLTPNGVSISKEGLKPDYEVDFDVEKYKKSKIDTQLQKAIEVLK